MDATMANRIRQAVLRYLSGEGYIVTSEFPWPTYTTGSISHAPKSIEPVSKGGLSSQVDYYERSLSLEPPLGGLRRRKLDAFRKLLDAQAVFKIKYEDLADPDDPQSLSGRTVNVLYVDPDSGIVIDEPVGTF
jgi:hypothetical protein